MRKPHEFPIEDIAEYWQLVRGVLVAGGMSKKEAAEVAKAYREYMKPAGWAFYNRDPEDAAAYAIKYAAWMRKEAEQAAPKPKAAPKRAKQSAKNEDTLPTKKEIATLPRWARVAFAARCARRVEPLFLKLWLEAPQKHVSAVSRAVVVAEQSAAAAFSAARDAATRDAAAAAPAAVLANADHAAHVAAAAAYATNAIHAAKSAANAARSAGEGAITPIRDDFRRVFDESRFRQWTDATPVPPAVFGPLWPEGPPADWPELPKPTKLKVTVQVPDGLDDAAVREKLQKLTAALARLNVAGGGHGLKLVPPIDFTHEQDKGRADVVREEGEKPQGRGHARRGR